MAAPVQNMRIDDHGRLYIVVPQQFLDRTDVVSILQEMRDKRMPEGTLIAGASPSGRWDIYGPERRATGRDPCLRPSQPDVVRYGSR